MSITDTAHWCKLVGLGVEVKYMKTEQIQIRIDETLKNKSDSVFKKMGITRSMAITLFLSEIVRQKDFPFKIKFNK